jgi:hypothetical protein
MNYLLSKLRADEFALKEKLKDLAGKEFSDQATIEGSKLVKSSLIFQSALSHQKMQIGMMIDSLAKGLDEGDDAGRKLLSRESF